MMPSSKKALIEGGLSKKAASFAQIGLFLAGALGIQILSRIMHQFMPSHVVDCDHTHEENHEEEDLGSCPDDEETQLRKTNKTISMRSASGDILGSSELQDGSRSFSTPEAWNDDTGIAAKSQWTALPKVLSSKKLQCDDDGRCYGYSDPCGTSCFWKLQAHKLDGLPSRPHIHRSATTSEANTSRIDEHTPLLITAMQERNGHASTSTPDPEDLTSSTSSTLSKSDPHYGHASTHGNDHGDDDHDHDQLSKSHHHHVPTNAFLSLGLQTSLAIALHKLPEGFITYATNHANPQLGVTVFLSLFIHNITEGFALALPLYLALQSRPRAMMWSALLGGLSQPLGAGIAALWFHAAGSGRWAPGQAMYGGMFAIVAGIMANVGMQLMGEAWALGHDRNLCILFAFIGMGILGFASALTK
jgi:ZIP family zinc transporter